MRITGLDRDNVDEYSDFLDPDAAENIGREYFRGMVLEADGEPRAAMVWEVENTENEELENEADLSWIRLGDRGCADELFEGYRESILEEEVVRSHFEFPIDEDKGLKPVLEEAGFSTNENEGREVCVRLKDVLNLKFLRGHKVPPYIKPVGDLMIRQFRNGVAECLLKTKRPVMSDLAMLPLRWYDPDISCYVESDGRITGMLLIHMMPSGKMRVELLAATGPDNRFDLLNLLRFSVNEAAQRVPEDTPIIIIRRDNQVRKLFSYFFPGEKGIKVLAGERKEE